MYVVPDKILRNRFTTSAPINPGALPDKHIGASWSSEFSAMIYNLIQSDHFISRPDLTGAFLENITAPR